MANSDKVKVAVIMSTYNGERFLKEQIESVLQQTDVSIELIVRDDGSKDSTPQILDEYKDKSLLDWYSGPNVGPAKSFFDCLSNAPDAEYYAFCDQDDIWDPDKLHVAIESIKKSKVPSLYCSNTLLVSSNMEIIRKSNYNVIGNFVESLMSNPVTGCTCVINKQLRDIVLQKIPFELDMHDWWLYRVCMAFNGYFYFDKTPHIRYRQHENNVIGGIFSKKKEIRHHLYVLTHQTGGLRYKMSKILYDYYPDISKQNKDILTRVINYKKNIRGKLKLIKLVLQQPFDNKIRNRIIVAILLNKY